MRLPPLNRPTVTATRLAYGLFPRRDVMGVRPSAFRTLAPSAPYIPPRKPL